MSITEPVLSSLAGPRPPNPVLVVISGSLELDPLNESIEGDFLRRLFVTSGKAEMLLRTLLGLDMPWPLDLIRLLDVTSEVTLDTKVFTGVSEKGAFTMSEMGASVFTIEGMVKL